jgi:membrane protein CcdC involved in cytochrome C biogenesis
LLVFQLVLIVIKFWVIQDFNKENKTLFWVLAKSMITALNLPLFGDYHKTLSAWKKKKNTFNINSFDLSQNLLSRSITNVGYQQRMQR